MRKRRQVVAMLLTVAMSVTLLPTETQAARGNSKQNVADEVKGQEMADSQSYRLETSSGGQIVEGMDGWELFDIPDIIEKEEVEEKGYIGRVREEEKDLNTFVFKNSDGTNTMRIYDYPVKYVDDDGDIRDITTDVEKRYDGAYETKDNDIKTVFSKYFGQGISLKSDNVDIELVPRGKDNASMYASGHISAKAIDKKTVSYAYGANTTLEYGLTYTGFKEDIVVSEYTGQTEYEFTLKTNGLYLSEEDGSYYLVDDKGTVQATIGDIIIFTADEANNTMGSMTYTTIRDGQEYLLTIHVDAEYLKDEKTVYPIRIDPTIEINYDNNGAGAIQDVTICSSKTQSGSSGSLYIGKRSGYGTCRVLMKFPTLSLSAIYSVNEITSATVELRDLMCETTAANIQCYVFNGNTWAESSATWSNASPNSYTTLLSSNSVSYANGKKQTTSHRYKFDITAAVKGWKTATYSQAKGIMFKADSTVENGSTYNYKTFASYNRASYKPSLSVSYKDKTYLNISVDTNYMLKGQTKAISVSKYPSNLSVVWYSSNRTVATVSSTGVITGNSPGTAIISATYIDASAGNTTITIKIEVIDGDLFGLEMGEAYNIMNASSGRYISLETQADTNLTNVYTRARSESTLSQWSLENVSAGKYQLISEYSATNKVLDVTNKNIDIYTDRNANYQKFNIYRMRSGVYKGLFVIRYGNYYVTQNTDYNVCLTDTISDSCYWSFMPVEKGKAVLYSVKIKGNIDTTENDYLFYPPYMDKAGYDTIEDVCNQTATTAFNGMLSADVFMFNGHGADGMIRFHSADSSCLGEISVNKKVVAAGAAFRKVTVGGDICSIESLNGNALAGLRCVLYLGCYTGLDVYVEDEDTTYNLLEETFDKGAHFVLGTTDQIYTYDSNPFLREFMNSISAGKSIEEAIDSALDCVTDRESFPIVYIGDAKQILAN